MVVMLALVQFKHRLSTLEIVALDQACRFNPPPVEAWAAAGPFHACGEHTAGVRTSLMEGALASGLRAADEVVAALPGLAHRTARG